MISFFQGWSKKLVAFLVYLAVVLLNKKLGFELTETDLYTLTGGLGAYTLGQGLADFGKEREKVARPEQ